jgi:hypothetical protein
MDHPRHKEAMAIRAEHLKNLKKKSRPLQDYEVLVRYI